MNILWQEICCCCCCLDCGVSSVISLMINRVITLLRRHKKRTLVVFYFALEAVSFTLDQLEKQKWGFLFVAFLLSAFVSSAVTYSYIRGRIIATNKSHAERQLGVLEVVFSILQLVPISFDFIVEVLSINVNYTIPCVFPLAFAMVATVFVFRKEESSSSDHLPYHKDDLSSTKDTVAVKPSITEFVPDGSIVVDVTETPASITTTEVDPTETTMTVPNQDDNQLRNRIQRMEKALIKVSMNNKKSRIKAMRTVAKMPGVTSVALGGDDQSLLEITEDGTDLIELTALLRKKFGNAEIISVTPFIPSTDEKSRVEIEETSDDEKRNA